MSASQVPVDKSSPPVNKSKVANLAQTFGTSVRAKRMSFERPQQLGAPHVRSPTRKTPNTSRPSSGAAPTLSSPSPVLTPKTSAEEIGGPRCSPRRNQHSKSSVPSPEECSENARTFATKKSKSSRISSLASAFESKSGTKIDWEDSVCKPKVMNGRSSLAPSPCHLPSKVASGNGRLSPKPMVHPSRSPRRMRSVYQKQLSAENSSVPPPPPSLLKASQHGRLSPPPPSTRPHTHRNEEGSPTMARKIGMFHQATISQPSPSVSTPTNQQADTEQHPPSLFQVSRNMNSHRRRREERSGRPSYQ